MNGSCEYITFCVKTVWITGGTNNVSQPESILHEQYVAGRLVRTTGGPINQLSIKSKFLPLALKLLQRAKVLLKSQNILNYNESK